MFSKVLSVAVLACAFSVQVQGATTGTAGLCSQHEDIMGKKGTDPKFVAAMDKAARKALGAASTVTNCVKVGGVCGIQTDPLIKNKLSPECAKCLGEAVECGTQKCSRPCMSSSEAADCKTCIESKCNDIAVKCHGN
eukprot:Pgem_evm1s1314